MPRRGVALSIAVVCVSAASAHALDQGRASSQYVITKWGAGTLPSDTIHALVQSRDHHLWLGTAAGLVRFDGAEVAVFDSASTPRLEGGGVMRLAEGRDGSLFIGTTGGTVLRHAGGVFEPLGLRTGTAYVSSLLAARDGSVWIGVHGHGTARWFEGRRMTFEALRGMQAPLAMAEDAEGGIWIGARAGGVARYHRGEIRRYEITRDVIQALCVDGGGALWAGTPHGLLRFYHGAVERFTRRDGLSHDDVSALLEDRDGNLWVGTAGGGLNRRSGGRWTQLTTREGLSDDDVRCLLEDDEGNLWVGTTAGLDCLSDGGGRFVTYGRFEGLSEPAVSSVALAAGGGVWLGMASGQVVRLRNGSVQRFALPPGVGREAAQALHEMRDGSLWIAQDNGRLFRLAGGVVSEHTPRNAPEDWKVRVIAEDEQGPLFLVAVLGPARIRDGRFVAVSPSPRRGFLRFPHAVSRDAAGALWVCDLHGLARLAGGEWRRFTTSDGLPHNRVRSASFEPDGGVWAATAGGLAFLKDGRIHAVTTEHGLPEAYLRLVLDDGLGHLWIAAMGRIFRLDKRELFELFAGRISRLRPVLFDRSDGLRASEGLLSNGPGVRGADGRLWFATVKGVSVIDPARVSVVEPAPPVVVERLTVDGRSVPPAWAQAAEYPPGRGEVRIEYTARSYNTSRKIQFRHRLEGLDRGWVEARGARRAYYSNLPPGSYRFSVMASNRDGVWNGAPVTVAFTIRPPLYRTPLFYTACALAALGLAAAAHRLRVQQMHARFAAVVRERTRIARELHDTLAQGLAGVKLHIDTALSRMAAEPALARRSMQCARSIAVSSLSEVRRSIWVLRAQAAKGDAGIGSSFSDSVRQLIADSDIQPLVRVEGEPRSVPVEVERDLLRIAHEALTNALRHSGARTLTIDLRFDADAVQLRVRDDGRGFDPDAYLRAPRGEHFGLLGMRERAHSAGGHLQVRSRAAEGTEVVCRLPYRGAAGFPAGDAPPSEEANP